MDSPNYHQEDREARLKLAYQVGALQGFLKYGLVCLSSIEIKDQAALILAIDTAIARIEQDAEKHSKS